MITSSKNNHMKNIMLLAKRAKARKEQGLYLVEGIRMVQEAPLADVVKVYISESFAAKLEASERERFDYEIISDQVFREISDTVTPQGILALVRRKEHSLEKVLESSPSPVLLLLERLQDPGNMGTIIRTGEAAAVAGIVVDKNTVDVYSPKVVRSTMGAIYRVPIICIDNLAAAVSVLRNRGVKIYAAHLKADKNYYDEDYTRGAAFLIGNEGNGLSEEAANLADSWIHIPMAGEVESLNASVAASLLVYESYVQKLRSD